MRLMYLTDIHEEVDGLAKVLASTNSDLYIVAGDLMYRAFKTQETLFRFHDVQERMRGLKRRRGWEGTPLALAEAIHAKPDEESAEDVKLARDYRRLTTLARKTMIEKYERMEDVFARYSDRPILVLPGNYDMDLQETPLAHRDLHLREHEVDGLRIAGYGGAAVFTPGIPEELVIPFVERKREDPYCEALDFFNRTRPDLAVTHQPPYGIFDKLGAYGNIGSPGLREYVDSGRSKVLLTGHMHENWGVELCEGTVCVNPSNFGGTLRPGKDSKGLYFCGIRLHAGFFLATSFREVTGDGYVDVVDYYPTPRGIRELILDPKRYLEMRELEPKRERHIREVRIFNRVKSYFRRFDTDEARDRVTALRELYRDFAERGIHVAFDVLGSVNVGLTEPTSDLDVVVYVRDTRVEAREHYLAEIPESVTAALERLGKEGLYDVHVLDAVNVQRVMKAIRRRDLQDPHLARFVLYRAIGRPVNLRFLKPVENALAERADFKYAVERLVRGYFRTLIRTGEHAYSFKKYVVRLQARDIQIPAPVEKRIREYLDIP